EQVAGVATAFGPAKIVRQSYLQIGQRRCGCWCVCREMLRPITANNHNSSSIAAECHLRRAIQDKVFKALSRRLIGMIDRGSDGCERLRRLLIKYGEHDLAE